MKEFFKSIRKQDIILLVVSFSVLLFIDQYTKYLIDTNFHLYESKDFINGFLNFTYVRNEGASFGMLQGRQTFFTILTYVVLPFMLFVYFKISVIINVKGEEINKLGFKLLSIAFMLMFTGAVGNFIDRLRFSYVIDFLNFEFIDFPVFNMADCYITVGTVVLLVISIIVKEKELDMILKPRRKW